MGPLAGDARHRQIPRFEDGHADGARSVDPVAPATVDAVDLIALTRSLVDIDSTTGREADVCRWLSSYLRSLGFTVVEQPVDERRFNVLAQVGAPHVVL